MMKYAKAVTHVFAGNNHVDFLDVSKSEQQKVDSVIPAFDATLVSADSQVCQ